MDTRGTYRTRQKDLVQACLESHADSYLTVDDAWALVRETGEGVGRSTVYRALEAMAAQGVAAKVFGPSGEARYRIMPAQGFGQLICLGCGKAFPLDCEMARVFMTHVYEHHGFKIESARTALYGYCPACQGACNEG